MLDHLNYLLALGFCVVITLPLEALGSGVYRRPRRLAAALVPAVLVFVVWDLAAVARGQWSFDASQILDAPRPGGLPVEELLFFLVVPTCALLTLEAVRGLLGRSRRRGIGAPRAAVDDPGRPVRPADA
jgi:lycopene cyclase domain-containing protein